MTATSSTGTTGGAGGTESAVACTDPGTDVTSICASATLDTLTAEEETQLCTDTGTYIAGAITRAAACKYYAIVTAASSSAPTEEEMQTVCSTAEADCNSNPSVMGPGANTLCSQIPDGCTATVEQYSACVTDEAVVFDQGAAALVGCSELTFENLATSYDVPTDAGDAPGCMPLKTACPSFTVPYIN